MLRNRICPTAIMLTLCLVAPTSEAVQVVTEGNAEVLIFPTIFSDENFLTLLTLRNESEQGLVAKVVTRDGRDGAELSNFNLFMSPNDSWVSAFYQDRTNGIIGFEASADATCKDAETVDDLGQLIQVQHGQAWVEIYALGALSDEDTDRLTVQSKIASGDRSVCDTDINRSEITLAPISASLTGEAQLISVDNGIGAAMLPVGLDKFDLIDSPATVGSLNDLSLASGQSRNATMDGRELEFDRPLDAVSAALMIASSSITYSTERVVAGKGHLLLTLPTRHLYAVGSAPFLDNTSTDTDMEGQELRAEHTDRNGYRYDQERTSVTQCSPLAPQTDRRGPVITQSQLNLSFAEPLLEYADTQPPSHSRPQSSCQTGFVAELSTTSGAYRLVFTDFSITATDGTQVTGLPVIMNSISSVRNGTLSDQSVPSRTILANYSWQNALVIKRPKLSTE